MHNYCTRRERRPAPAIFYALMLGTLSPALAGDDGDSSDSSDGAALPRAELAAKYCRREQSPDPGLRVDRRSLLQASGHPRLHRAARLSIRRASRRSWRTKQLPRHQGRGGRWRPFQHKLLTIEIIHHYSNFKLRLNRARTVWLFLQQTTRLGCERIPGA
jgi:hypothetical protein